MENEREPQTKLDMTGIELIVIKETGDLLICTSSEKTYVFDRKTCEWRRPENDDERYNDDDVIEKAFGSASDLIDFLFENYLEDEFVGAKAIEKEYKYE